MKRSRALRRYVPCAVTLALAAFSSSASAEIGSDGLGDSLYPQAGNGGYEVSHYDLDLSYKPGRRQLSGDVTILANAQADLTRFNLDFNGLDITGLTVNGEPAEFDRERSELIVTPQSALPSGAPFEVEVRYRGKPRSVAMPGYRMPTGWVATKHGAFVANEPRGAPTWFPCNDHPSDKATYRFEVTVPNGHTAVANGVLKSKRTRGPGSTFVWVEKAPMATYLATVTNGRMDLVRTRANGLRGFSAMERSRVGARGKAAIREHEEMIEFTSDWLGEYPFESYGVIVADAPDSVNYALETQGRPLYTGYTRSEIYAHEVAHQWFGNSVTLAQWKDIWLNEGFASWAEWYWSQEEGRGRTTEQMFRREVRQFDEIGWWDNAPGLIDRRSLIFNSVTVYSRGAMTLEALRQEVGDEAFFSIMRRWVSEYAYSSVTTADFIALASDESGQDLDGFFDQWLYSRERPDIG